MLWSLTQPFTQNDYILNDAFDAVSKNRSLQHKLFDEGYQYVSIDFKLVSTNVPGFIIRS